MTQLSEVDIIYLFATALVFALLFIMVLVYIFFNKKKSELICDRQLKEAQYHQELTLAIIEMKETTLSYIGQELHDDLGQKMSVAKLLVNQGLENAEGSQKEILKEINAVIGESIRDIRSLSKSFISEQVENLGLVDSIHREVARIDRLNLMQIIFTYNVSKINLESRNSLILFRIIQECINNILKHSRAKNMKISLQDNEDTLEISLEDDGIGFDNDVKNGGSGLMSMKKRANLINTDFFLTSAKGKGTTIQLRYFKTK